MFFIYEFFYSFVIYLIIIISMLLTVAFFTVYERKVLASVHQRVGPNKVGPFGTLQAIADGVKLFLKEFIFPVRSNRFLFVFAPMLSFFLSLLLWLVMPFGYNGAVLNFNMGLIYILLLSSLNVYGVIIAGWAGNSRYSFLGSLRSAAQMISYELTMGTCLVTVVLFSGSLNLTEIVAAQTEIWYFWPLWPTFFLFFICCLAETNRTPFDLPEAESELVSGYNTEHAAFPFAFFFLAEYSNILFLSCLNVILFFGGWIPIPNCVCFSDYWFFFLLTSGVWFFFKVAFFMSLFILVRASVPRYRYDQLMRLGWKVFLPLSFLLLALSIGFVFLFDGYVPIF